MESDQTEKVGASTGADKPLRRLHHPNPEIERIANKHYREDPVTRKLVDDIFESGNVITEPFVYPEGGE